MIAVSISAGSYNTLSDLEKLNPDFLWPLLWLDGAIKIKGTRAQL